MTFNSSNEKEVLKKVFPHDKHIELVPDNKDPRWFGQACESKINCDVLLISGHFGGMFFGEKSTSLLSLGELETAACSNTCGNILNAKKVFLMGCNTLASKTPDHRSIEDYLRVLMFDGFPRNLAEEVATSRYVDYGLAMAERMSVSFNQASDIYGFSSTGPLGVYAAPRLEKGFRTGAMKEAFSGTSFRILDPKKEISQKDLTTRCNVLAPERISKSEAYSRLFSNGNLRRHFDLILANVHDRSLESAINKNDFTEASRANLTRLAEEVLLKDAVLIGSKFRALKLLLLLGQLNRTEYQSKVYFHLENRMKGGLDPIVVDQICEIAKQDQEIVFRSAWLKRASSDRDYWSRLYGCFQQKEKEASDILLNWLTENNSAPVKRETIRALEKSALESNKSILAQASRQWPFRDQYELSLKVSSRSVSPCNSTNDDVNWGCFNNLKSSFANISQCQDAASGFKSKSGIGADWHCLKAFTKQLHLGACIRAGQKYDDAEKADDFIQYCWDQVRAERDVSRSECLGFGQAMKIPGNRLKHNWNCMNQVK